MKTITPKSLKKWCADRRGRAASLAKLLGKSREFVRQMGALDRPIPHDVGKLLSPAMNVVEMQEKKAFALAQKRVRDGRSA